MLDILRDRTFRTLFAAQVASLLGTGLLTVALALLAYDLAGEGAALVLGTVFTIKMVAYVGVAPIAGAIAGRVPRRAFLISLDLLRAAAALAFPFVTESWQAFALVFVLQTASAAFTPTFQATIPDVLPDEARYTRALSLSRLAYDLENIASPALAAALLLVFSGTALFFGTVAGFLLSALLILRVTLPAAGPAGTEPFRRRVTRGIRIYLATPRLRGLLALNLAAAAAGAMVLVNTIVLVRVTLGRPEPDVAIAMAAFGIGSMLAALILPPLLDRTGDRPVMLAAAGCLVLSLVAIAVLTTAFGPSWPLLLAGWAAIGLAYSALLTPSGRLLRRSSTPPDRPALFAAQFALSHACWLVTYPLAGWLMTAFGTVTTLLALAAVAAVAGVAAWQLWPAGDPTVLPHDHPDLPPDHPHIAGQPTHAHVYRIDDLHPVWPGRG